MDLRELNTLHSGNTLLDGISLAQSQTNMVLDPNAVQAALTVGHL